jgi:hypothetical protein
VLRCDDVDVGAVSILESYALQCLFGPDAIIQDARDAAMSKAFEIYAFDLFGRHRQPF